MTAEVERDLSDYLGRPLRVLWRGDRTTATGALALGAGRDVDGYAVEEDTSEPFPGRVWHVAKQDVAGDVYRVESGPEGWHCSCLGFTSASRAADAECERVRRTLPWVGRIPAMCKHTTAMAWLLDHGHLDPAPVHPADAPDGEELERLLCELAARSFG